MKMKKVCSVVLAASVMATSVPATPLTQVQEILATANEAFTVDGITYRVNSDNLTCTITKIDDVTVSEFVIPDMATDEEGLDYEITSIDDKLFKGQTGLKSVTFGKYMKNIGVETFSGCTGLTEINFPKSMETLGYDAFYGCTGLTSLTITKNISDTVGLYDGYRSPFRDCVNIKQVVLQDGMTTVCSGLFVNCTWLTEVSIPDSVTTIDSDAFKGCTALEEISIPSSVTQIGHEAFMDCTALKKIPVMKGLEKLGYSAFANCTAATEVMIPKKLTGVTGLYDNDRSPFGGCTGLTSIVFESGIKTIANTLFANCTYIKSMELPETVETIGDNAFKGCTSLQKITIPDGVTVIGASAFARCGRLSEIKFPTALTKIEPMAFSECSRIEEFIFPGNLETIGYDAFYKCNSVESVTIPSTLKDVSGLYDESRGIFRDCENLTTVNFAEGTTTVVANILSGNAYVTKVNIPQGVKEIGNDSFKNCTAIKTIKIPNSVEKIGKSAFAGCKRLETVSLPRGLKEIGFDAFYDCDVLNYVKINADINRVFGLYENRGVFRDCEELKSFEITNAVTSIPAYLFANCPAEYLIIPGTVENIANKAITSNLAGFTIYGVEGSAAQTYAENNNMIFKASSLAPSITTPDNEKEDETSETSAPATSAPATSAPVTSAPVTDAPATDAPATSAPATSAPATSAPATSAPTTSAPVTPTPEAVEKPGKVSVSSTKRTGAKTAKVTWKKISKVAGYEIVYSTKSNFKTKSVRTVEGSKTSYSLKGLKKNTKYYVKIRAYRKYATGKKLYGSYSKVMTIAKKK